MDGGVHPEDWLMPVAITIDWDAIRERILTGAFDGLLETAEYALDRARHHAPVRSIFKGRRRGPEIPSVHTEAMGQRAWRTMRSQERFAAFARSVQRRRSMDIDVPDAPPLGRLMERPGASYVTGNPQTLVPVLRRGNTLITGDLRVYDPQTRRLAKVTTITQRRGVSGYAEVGEIERGGRQYGRYEREAGGTRARGIEYERYIPVNRGIFSAQPRLTSRGRFEVKNAASRGLFQGRVGGRLRGELRLTPITQRGTTYWIHVESPTPYAVYQEFGTRHHRAQPFLRPALYEAGRVLSARVGRGAQGTLHGAGREISFSPTSSRARRETET
jgi:hypothetical protein